LIGHVDRLAQVCGQYLGKGQQVAIEGWLQTRQWEDDRGQRHWKTEVVATSVEMLSGRRKRDYDAESLVEQASGDAATTADATAELSDGESDESSEDASTEDDQVLVLA
jgi:single-strand DNA-binding protein